MVDLEEQKSLTNRLDTASFLYYQGKTTEFTDEAFDRELHRLQKMEADSGVIYPNSPTKRVGSDIQEGFKKGEHPVPMLTIDNTYDDEGVRKWLEKVYKLGARTITIGIKYDGVSCELKYENGYLAQALTRGDKNIGDDITENVKTIKNIPLRLQNGRVSSPFYVRGEVLLPKSSLSALNAAKIAKNEVPFANTRNACSGSLKQLDPKVTASRCLMFKPWGFVFTDREGNPCVDKMYVRNYGDVPHNNGLYEVMESMPWFGFDFTGGLDAKKVSFESLDSIGDIIADIADYRETLKKSKLDFDYDGIVLKVDDLALQNRIGTKDTRAIEWGLARKWNEEYAAKTTVKAIEWSVGKTGAVTPVGILEPVEVEGATVSRVSLNNRAFIENLDLSYGDEVSIVRSGGVIPYVTGVVRHGLGEPVKFPEFCPVCGAPLKQIGEEIYCTSDFCPAKVKGQILHWCSKDCLDVRGIGESVVDDMYRLGIRSILEMYAFMLTDFPDKLAEKFGEGYGVKSIAKMQKALWDSTKKPLDRVVNGLPINGVGKVTARLLTDFFGTWDELMRAPEEVLKDIPGIGDVMAKEIYNWFHELVPYNWSREVVPNNWFHEPMEATLSIMRGQQWKGRLESLGFKINESPKGPDAAAGNTSLAGLTIVFTGKSNWFSGDDVEKHIEWCGGKTSHSVSKNTSYLVTGEKPGGSKVAKANELGVPVLTEYEFYEKFGVVPTKPEIVPTA